MSFPFDETKATQAAAHALKRVGGSMNAYNLLKILYLANRESLVQRGIPFTGDELRDLPDGPVAQTTYDLLKGSVGYWGRHISKRVGYEVRVLEDPGEGALSEYETRLLDGLVDRFGRLKYDELRAEAHRWPEHTETGSGAHVIDPEEILRSGGYTEEEIGRVRVSADEFVRLDRPGAAPTNSRA
ncbi:MAG: Panacea domain-containing protein [Candidatus Coatesbacteria bacterium]